MFSVSVKLLNLFTPSSFFNLPLSLILFISPVSQPLYYMCVHTHACVLTVIWTVLQAKVQRLFLRVRI